MTEVFISPWQYRDEKSPVAVAEWKKKKKKVKQNEIEQIIEWDYHTGLAQRVSSGKKKLRLAEVTNQELLHAN